MTAEQIVFLIIGAAGLGLAILTVTARDLVRSAFALIGSLFAVAGLYAMLSAGLLAVAQVIVYVGAIATLIVLAVMLTAQPLRARGPQTARHWPLAALIALIVLAGLGWALSGYAAFTAAPPPLPAADSLTELGRALIDPQRFLIPFEATSVLLLAALIGAVTVAGGGKKD
jgi:NADH-quinone oxidoreductase subunit J